MARRAILKKLAGTGQFLKHHETQIILTVIFTADCLSLWLLYFFPAGSVIIFRKLEFLKQDNSPISLHFKNTAFNFFFDRFFAGSDTHGSGLQN